MLGEKVSDHPERVDLDSGQGRSDFAGERPKVAEERQLKSEPADASPPASLSRVKFEIYGEEMIEKRVKASGNSGRVYLPPDWVGRKVKIIRID